METVQTVGLCVGFGLLLIGQPIAAVTIWLGLFVFHVIVIRVLNYQMKHAAKR